MSDPRKLWPRKTLDALAKHPHSTGWKGSRWGGGTPNYNEMMSRASLRAAIREADAAIREVKRRSQFKSAVPRRESVWSWSRKLAVKCKRPIRFRPAGETEWQILPGGATTIKYLETLARAAKASA